jgi:hypothetical protein
MTLKYHVLFTLHDSAALKKRNILHIPNNFPTLTQYSFQFQAPSLNLFRIEKYQRKLDVFISWYKPARNESEDALLQFPGLHTSRLFALQALLPLGHQRFWRSLA